MLGVFPVDLVEVDGVVGEAGVATGQVFPVAFLVGFGCVAPAQVGVSHRASRGEEFEVFACAQVALAVVESVFAGAGVWVDVVEEVSVQAELDVFFALESRCFLLSLSLLLLWVRFRLCLFRFFLEGEGCIASLASVVPLMLTFCGRVGSLAVRLP